MGTVTDGDIRRYILRGENLTDKINTITNKNSYACNFNSLKFKKNILEKKLIDLSLKSIPVLKNKKIIELYSQFHKETNPNFNYGRWEREKTIALYK